MELKGKAAIITGAARGLGLLVARALASEGMSIARADERAEELKTAMEGIAKNFGARVLAFPVNIGDEQAVAEMIQQTLRSFGGIDVLVNNAGVRITAPVWKTGTDVWDRIHDS